MTFIRSVRSVALTAVSVKIRVFQDVMYSLVDGYQHFEGPFRVP
jgi:hypothetical protein